MIEIRLYPDLDIDLWLLVTEARRQQRRFVKRRPSMGKDNTLVHSVVRRDCIFSYVGICTHS